MADVPTHHDQPAGAAATLVGLLDLWCRRRIIPTPGQRDTLAILARLSRDQLRSRNAQVRAQRVILEEIRDFVRVIRFEPGSPWGAKRLELLGLLEDADGNAAEADRLLTVTTAQALAVAARAKAGLPTPVDAPADEDPPEPPTAPMAPVVPLLRPRGGS